MSIDRRTLVILGQRHPAIYDIIPRGPLSRFSEVALNPQPLPPHELGAAIAAEFGHNAWLADRFGLEVGPVFDDLDDWCPTGLAWPKPPLWWDWWIPIPEPEPEPHPDWITDFHLGFAARLAAVSVGFEGTRLGESLDKAIERSLGAIESSNT
jgi:hypothetical protein